MVTHEGTKEDKGYYFPRLYPTKIYDELTHKAIMIKFTDRLSNLTAMPVWDNARKAHYLQRSRFWKVENGEVVGSTLSPKRDQAESQDSH